MKNKAYIKFYQILFSIGLDNVDIYLGDGSLSSDVGIVNLHEPRGTHRVAYTNNVFFIKVVVPLLKIYLALI